MELNQDFEDLLRAFADEGVDFVIVGAHALAAHGHVRATGDLDVLVRPTSENAALVYRALGSFGAPLRAHGVGPDDFAREGTVYQMGLPPQRIDILTSISGVTFDECVQDHLRGELGTLAVRFIGLDAQIKNKRSSGRTKDTADAEVLEALKAHHARS